jgi:hypothetical protein
MFLGTVMTMNKLLKPISVTYESAPGSDLIYVYIQKQNYFKEHPLSQMKVSGNVLYGANNKWNGFSFEYNEQIYRVLFDEEKGTASEDPTWLMIDINDLEIFGIESISAQIKGLELAEKYLVEEDIEVEKF